jgi:hypothetical protein
MNSKNDTYPKTVNNGHIYTAKIIKANALLSDSKLFISQWEPQLSTEENIKNAIEYNIFGKSSRTFTKNIIHIFKNRFIFGDDQDNALRVIIKSNVESTIIDRILYYYTMCSDPLLYDFVAQYLYNSVQIGDTLITTNKAEKYFKKLSDEGKTNSKWSDIVCNRVARNVLTTLRDFHILEGKVKKYIAPTYLPLESFVYIAYLINRKSPGGERVLNHNDWKLFLLNSKEVERLFLEAHQRGFLTYYAAGSIIRITFKQKDIVEVANDIIQ